MEKTAAFPIFQRLWISRFRPLLIFHHPESVKVLLKTTEPKPRAPGTVYVIGLPWLGEGLLIANGDHWARNRRLLTPAFHFDILQPYTLVYNQAVDILVEKLDQFAESGKSFELFSVIGMLSLDVILRCAFSYKSDCQILGVAEEIIQKRRETLEREGLPNKSSGRQSRYLDFLDILLTAKDENNQGLTPLEIRNEVDTFLFEGEFKDMMKCHFKFVVMILQLVPSAGQSIHCVKTKIIRPEYRQRRDLQCLDYLTLCIKEGMRFHSPVSFIQRETTKELFIEEKVIPAGTIIAVNIYNLHHNPMIWENPLEFQPDRFLPENSVNRDSYTFIPFSAGP
ncbi:hypothetical protein KUTeg_001362, partial [Tegillarca granosa]